MAMPQLLVTAMRVAGFVCFDARYGDEWEDGDWDEWDGWDEGWWVRYGSDAAFFCKLNNYMVAMACKATCSNLNPTFSGRDSAALAILTTKALAFCVSLEMLDKNRMFH